MTSRICHRLCYQLAIKLHLRPPDVGGLVRALTAFLAMVTKGVSSALLCQKNTWMIAKIYLVVVSLTYIGLALWCSFQPNVTAEKVGFELISGSGQSEFLTVYGGLEFGLALVLLASLIKSDTVYYGVVACVLIHVSLVLFRSVGFFCFSELDPITYKLAIGEWVITLLGIAILYSSSKNG